MELKNKEWKINDKLLFENVAVVEEIDKKAFDNNYIFTVNDVGVAMEVVDKIGKQLTREMGDISLGYGNSQALVFFSHNTPNNSLPIFGLQENIKF